MIYEIARLEDMPDAYTVESVGEEGEVFKANFYGPDAFNRASAYASWRVIEDKKEQEDEPPTS